MSDTNRHELQVMIDSLLNRDKNAVEEISQKNFWGGSPPIEDKIWLADGRSLDALSAVLTLARYIIKKEEESK